MKVAYQRIKSFIKSTYIPKKEPNITDTSETFLKLGTQLVQAAADAKNIHYALLDREKILSTINIVAFNFLDPNIDAWDHLSSFIEKLGQLMSVDRIFLLCYNKKKDTLSILEDYMYENLYVDVSISDTLDQFKDIPHEKDFEFYFQTKISIWRSDEKLRSSIKHHLNIFRIKSLCAVPIIIGDELYGTLVVQDCVSPRVWSKLEIDTLQIISNLLSAWRKRSALEESLKFQQERLEETVLERTEKLYRSNEVFKSLTESSPDSIIRFDCNYKCIFANKVVSTHSGVNTKSFLFLSLEEIFLEETAQIVKNVLDYIVENSEGFRIELQFPKTKLWIDWKFEPELDSSNDICAITAIGRNITRRKLADDTLAEYLDFQTESTLVQESAYKTIFNILSSPAIICNTSNLIVDANKLAKKTFLNKHLVGSKCFDLFVNEDCISKYKNQIQDDNIESCQFLGELKDTNKIYNIVLSIIPNTKNFILVFEKNC